MSWNSRGQHSAIIQSHTSTSSGSGRTGVKGGPQAIPFPIPNRHFGRKETRRSYVLNFLYRSDHRRDSGGDRRISNFPPAMGSCSLRIHGTEALTRGCEKPASCRNYLNDERPLLRFRPPQRRLWAAKSALAKKFVTAVADLDPFPHRGEACGLDRGENRRVREAVTSEKLDGWLRDSIHEIVRNIGKAPFVVQIFSSPTSASTTSVVMVEAESKGWPSMRKRWEREGLAPDVIILVEELKDEKQQQEEEIRGRGCCCADNDDGGGGGERECCGKRKKTWGLLVQGRGLECPMCYILSTCRVRSSVGFCTHFCLVRATCFGESAEAQLQKAWLQGR